MSNKHSILLFTIIIASSMALTGYTLSYFNDKEISKNNIIQVSNSWENKPYLLINEVMYNPTFNDYYNEWIELYNPTDKPIDVNGWSITDNAEEDPIQGDDINGNGTTIIPPYGYAIITDSNTHVYDNFTIPENAVKLRVEDNNIGNSLGNGNDKIILKNATGAIVDAIEWGSDYTDIPGSPMSGVDEGHSMARYVGVDTNNTSTDFYDENNPTPGSENTV